MYELKQLLEVEQDGLPLRVTEQQQLEEFEKLLLPKICERLRAEYADEIDEATAKMLLHVTWIKTNCETIRNITNQNLFELSDALSEISPATPLLNSMQLNEIYCRLLIVIARKITQCQKRLERKLGVDEVLACRIPACPLIEGYPDLAQLPGSSVLDKKLLFGGFDLTELPAFHRQKVLAVGTIRELKSLGLQRAIERLSVSLLDLHRKCRDQICRSEHCNDNPGPKILARMRPDIPSLPSQILPDAKQVDEQFCLGLLWNETNLCHAWWHGLENKRVGGAL